MESTSSAISSMKALKFMTPSSPKTPQKVITTTTSTTKPKLVSFSYLSKRPSQLSLGTRCSTKPDTNTDSNIEDQDSTFDIELGPEIPDSPKADSSTDLSSLSPPSTFSSGGLVFDLGAGNSWDSSDIGSPVVKRFLSDEEERWYMWYHGRSSSSSNSDSIGLAVSGNGVHWERGPGPVQSSRDVGSVMSSSKDWWAFDTLSVRPSEVVVMSSSKVRASSAVYWMYYTGLSSEEVEVPSGSSAQRERVNKSLPGLAISQDGRHWARIEGEHHSGALLDVGSENEWDSSFIASPQVVFHGTGDLRMFYHSLDPESGKFSVGVARSRDGIRWLKLGKVALGGQKGKFDEMGVMSPHVVKKKDGKYLMAYEGVGPNGERSIGLAESRDGLREWARVHSGPVLEAQIGWDHMGVGSPCLVQMDGEEDEWRLYYRGVGSEGRVGIGMASSCGSDVTRFRRWSGFHL